MSHIGLKIHTVYSLIAKGSRNTSSTCLFYKTEVLEKYIRKFIFYDTNESKIGAVVFFRPANFELDCKIIIFEIFDMLQFNIHLKYLEFQVQLYLSNISNQCDKMLKSPCDLLTNRRQNLDIIIMYEMRLDINSVKGIELKDIWQGN